MPEPSEPSIESVLAKWTGCWCETQMDADHDPRVRDCPQHGSDDCRHMAEGIAVDLQSLAAREARLLAEAWDEGLRFGQLHWATNYAGVYQNSPLRQAPNPYRAAAVRGEGPATG